MLRFLAGILVVQAASVVLVAVAPVIDPADWRTWLPVIFALAMIALVAAFWFHSLAAGLRRDALERLRDGFAREREDLRVRAEREKTRLLKKGHKDMASATRRAESRANRKAALAVAAAGALGVLLIAASFMTVGLLMLAAAGGAVGGFFAGRRSTAKLPPGSDAPRQRRLRDRLSLPGRD